MEVSWSRSRLLTLLYLCAVRRSACLVPLISIVSFLRGCGATIIHQALVADMAAMPVPETVTAVPGGPVPGKTCTAGVTAKLAALVAVPAGVVTVIGPVEPGIEGTVAVICVSGLEVTIRGGVRRVWEPRRRNTDVAIRGRSSTSRCPDREELHHHGAE